MAKAQGTRKGSEMVKQILYFENFPYPVPLPDSHRRKRMGDRVRLNGEWWEVFYIEDCAEGHQNVRLDKV